MSLKHAILVLLESSPGSGYDLTRRFATGIGHFWNSSHQQIYQELKALHAKKWVKFEVEAQDDRPEKKVYAITPPGRRALKAWFAQTVKPPRVRDALLVKVYGGHLADPARMLAELRQHRALHQRQLEQYRAMELGYLNADAASRRRFRLPYLTLRRGIRYERGSIEWLDEAAALLESGGMPAEPVD